VRSDVGRLWKVMSTNQQPANACHCPYCSCSNWIAAWALMIPQPNEAVGRLAVVGGVPERSQNLYRATSRDVPRGSARRRRPPAAWRYEVPAPLPYPFGSMALANRNSHAQCHHVRA